MLGSYDNIVNAGINFEANVRDLEKSETSLSSLNDTLQNTAASAGFLSEGTNKANRSLDEQARSATTASSGLAGLQSQLASTRLAQESLEDSSGDLKSALQGLDSEAEGMVVNETVENLIGNLDDLNDAPDDFSLDEHLDSEGDVEKLVRSIGGLDGGLDSVSKESGTDISALKDMSDALDTFDDGFQKGNFEEVFSDFDVGEMVRDFPLNPRSDDFPDEIGELDTHIFDQLHRNSPFESFQELMESDEDIISDFLEAGNTNLDRDKPLDSFGDENDPLFSQDIRENLKEHSITRVDDFFGASDDTLADVMEDTSLGAAGITPDELRESAAKKMAERKIDGEKLGDSDFESRSQLQGAGERLLDDRTSPDHPKNLKNKIDKGFFYDKSRDAAMELVGLMEEYDEINRAMQDAGTLKEAKENFSEIDHDGMARIQKWAEEKDRVDLDLDSIGQSMGMSGKVDFDQVMGENLKFDNDHQVELMRNMMSDLKPELISGMGAGNSVPLTRETMGLRAMQELMGADEDTDRHDAIQGILKSIYHPKKGMQNSLLDEDGVMTGSFYENLRDRLPDDVTTSGGYSDNPDQTDIARDITDYLRGEPKIGEERVEGENYGIQDKRGIEDFIGDDSENIGDVVSGAVNKNAHDNPNVLNRALRETEDALPELLEMYSAQIAPGLDTSADVSEDTDIASLVPNADVLDPGKDQDGNDRKPQFGEWLNNLQSGIRQLQEVQDEASALRKGVLGSSMSDDKMNKGLFGALTQEYAFRTDSPKKVRKFRESLKRLSRTYKSLIPTVDATSLSLGPINVGFEKMSVMVFKLTSSIGPLITTLGGLASAIGVATAAMGGFLAVGAISLLEEMENTMAGVSNKREAMEQLMGTLKNMAMEAIEPLRQARLGGDGKTGMNLFVDSLRGALQILNRISNILAYVIELDTFGEEVERLSDFLTDAGGDAELARQLGNLVEHVLPVLTDMIIALMSNFGDFADFASELTGKLGGEFLDLLGDIGPALGLLIMYGSGFILVMMKAIGVIGQLISLLAVTFNHLAGLLNVIPGVSVAATDLAFAVGVLVGVLNLASRAAAVMAGQSVVLSGAYKYAAAGASFLTTSNMGLASSLALVSAMAGLAVIQLLAFMEIVDTIKGMDPGLSLDFAKDLGWVATLTSLIVGLGKLQWLLKGGFLTKGQIWAKLLPKLKNAAALVWMIGRGLAWVGRLAVGVLAGFLGVSSSVAAAMVALVAILPIMIDLIWYLDTGNSLLLDWESHFKTMAKYAESIVEDMNAIPGIDIDTGARDAPRFAKPKGHPDRIYPTGEDNPYPLEENASAKKKMQASIEVRKDKSDFEMARLIRREIRNWWSGI